MNSLAAQLSQFSHILSDSTINHFLKYYGHTAICLFLILSWCLLKYLFKSLLYHGTNWLTTIKLWNTNLLSRSNMNGFRIIWFGRCSEKTRGIDFVYIFTHQMSVTATASDLRTTKPYSYLHSNQFHRTTPHCGFVSASLLDILGVSEPQIYSLSWQPCKICLEMPMNSHKPFTV